MECNRKEYVFQPANRNKWYAWNVLEYTQCYNFRSIAQFIKVKRASGVRTKAPKPKINDCISPLQIYRTHNTSLFLVVSTQSMWFFACSFLVSFFYFCSALFRNSSTVEEGKVYIFFFMRFSSFFLVYCVHERLRALTQTHTHSYYRNTIQIWVIASGQIKSN